MASSEISNPSGARLMVYNSDHRRVVRGPYHIPVVLIIFILAALSSSVTVQQIPHVNAQPSPSLTIQPVSQPLATPGSAVVFHVTVQGMPANFAGWDLYVIADNTVLTPTAITLCNNITCNTPYSDSGGTNFMPSGTDAQCINNVNSGAFNNCGGFDGPGVAHDTFASSGSTLGGLLLFDVTFNAVAGPGATVGFPESVTSSTSQNQFFDTSGIGIFGVSETGGTYGTPGRSTTTSVTCSPGTVQTGTASTCTATVTDSASGTASTPTGSVSLTSNSTGTFNPTVASCALVATTADTASCSVDYTPNITGHHLITGLYNGDATHATSQGAFNVATTAPPLHTTTTAVQCSPASTTVDTATTCTATVTDTSPTPTIPGGTVSFTTNGSGTFAGSPAGTCLLSGSGSFASCQVGYTPSAVGSGTHAVTASYHGDSSHSSSSGLTSVTVSGRPAATLGSVYLSSSSVSVGQKIVIAVNITNSEPTAQTFTTRVKWGAITVAEQNVTLNPGEERTVALSWDTSSYSPGTANVTVVIPQSGTVQNAGPLTLNSPGPSFPLASILLAAGIGAAIVVVAAIIWLVWRGRKV